MQDKMANNSSKDCIITGEDIWNLAPEVNQFC